MNQKVLKMRPFLAMMTALCLAGFAADEAGADFLSSLKSATRKIEQMNSTMQAQQNQQRSAGNTAPRQGGGPAGKLHDPASVTAQCMAYAKSYRWKLVGERLQKQYQESMRNLSPEERTIWSAERRAVNEAARKSLDEIVPPDPANPYSYWQRLTAEDHAYINQEHAEFQTELSARCQAANAQALLAADQAVVLENKVNQESRLKGGALGAGYAGYMTGAAACQEQSAGYMYKLMADQMEWRLGNTGDMPMEERQEWLADIASLRDAHARKLTRPDAVDPANPSRALNRLSEREMMMINAQSISYTTQVGQVCQSQFTFR